MHYEESHIGENNVRPSMDMHKACNQDMMYILRNISGGNSGRGDFLRIRINDIEDMLLLPEAWLSEASSEDLQLRVESYQKKINVTKPQTTKSGIRKRDPYTPYQDPQGFIYVDNKGRNKLMRLDELYKFSHRTLTGLRTSLDDITKGYQMVVHAKEEDRSLLMERKELIFIIKAIDSAV
ncbi:hypothetical protein Tco_0723366 [Tanacetum coccineum]